jgi:hypothetical protein
MWDQKNNYQLCKKNLTRTTNIQGHASVMTKTNIVSRVHHKWCLLNRVKYVFSPNILRNYQELSLYFKIGKKQSHKFFRYQEWSIPSDFSRSANRMLIYGPTILILVPTCCKIGKNGPYIIKNYGIFFIFFNI